MTLRVYHAPRLKARCNMSKETETYRLELERLIAFFPDKRVINRTQLMKYTGKGRTWLNSHGFTGTEFTLVGVANKLSKLK